MKYLVQDEVSYLMFFKKVFEFKEKESVRVNVSRYFIIQFVTSPRIILKDLGLNFRGVFGTLSNLQRFAKIGNG